MWTFYSATFSHSYLLHTRQSILAFVETVIKRRVVYGKAADAPSWTPNNSTSLWHLWLWFGLSWNITQFAAKTVSVYLFKNGSSAQEKKTAGRKKKTQSTMIAVNVVLPCWSHWCKEILTKSGCITWQVGVQCMLGFCCTLGGILNRTYLFHCEIVHLLAMAAREESVMDTHPFWKASCHV